VRKTLAFGSPSDLDSSGEDTDFWSPNFELPQINLEKDADDTTIFLEKGNIVDLKISFLIPTILIKSKNNSKPNTEKKIKILYYYFTSSTGQTKVSLNLLFNLIKINIVNKILQNNTNSVEASKAAISIIKPEAPKTMHGTLYNNLTGSFNNDDNIYKIYKVCTLLQIETKNTVKPVDFKPKAILFAASIDPAKKNTAIRLLAKIPGKSITIKNNETGSFEGSLVPLYTFNKNNYLIKNGSFYDLIPYKNVRNQNEGDPL
jgi:hypothetical protein